MLRVRRGGKGLSAVIERSLLLNLRLTLASLLPLLEGLGVLWMRGTREHLATFTVLFLPKFLKPCTPLDTNFMQVDSKFAVIPSPRGEGFVKLSKNPQGTVFSKQILHFGDLLYPGVSGGKVTVDESFAEKLIQNFHAGVNDIVQTPIVGSDNEHTEDPLRNIGEVVEVYSKPDGVYVDIDVRKHVEDIGKTLLGASAFLNLNETDRKTGKKVGPALRHVAITNVPYVTNLTGFEQLVAASSKTFDTNPRNVVVLSTTQPIEGKMNTLDELIAELKTEHGIDVVALQRQAEQVDEALAFSASVKERLLGADVLKLSATGETTNASILTAISDTVSQVVALTSELTSIREQAAKDSAKAEVDKLVTSGHIIPANRDAMMELRLSNEPLFRRIIPTSPIVALTTERGSSVELGEAEAVEAEVLRLTTRSQERVSGKKKTLVTA